MVDLQKITGRRLAYDYSRCNDSSCSARYECLRYLTRHQLGERTPITTTFMEPGGCRSMIQIDKGEWIAWKGGLCPVDANRKVQVLFSDRKLENATTGFGKDFNWSCDVDQFMEIVAFRICD